MTKKKSQLGRVKITVKPELDKMFEEKNLFTEKVAQVKADLGKYGLPEELRVFKPCYEE